MVRATLDLPLSARSDAPMAALRARYLGETVRHLAEQGVSVTVFGDLTSPGGTAAPSYEESVRSAVEAMAPTAKLYTPQPSVEDAKVLGDLVATHDAFVNDTFQWSYLPLPSLVVPPETLPSAAGIGMERDLEIAQSLLTDARRPFVAILGGAHSDLRLHRLAGLVLRADVVAVGGAMAVPFLEAIGKIPPRGTDEVLLSECRAVIGLAERVQHTIQLPVDLLVRRPNGSTESIRSDELRDRDILDIGAVTVRRFAEMVDGADTVVWAGSLGHVEDHEGMEGTLGVARELRRRGDRQVVVGGEALVALLQDRQLLGGDYSLITATDSLLELLKNGDLPGLPPLRKSAGTDRQA